CSSDLNSLGDGGLAGIDVGGDSDVANLGHVAWHRYSFFFGPLKRTLRDSPNTKPADGSAAIVRCDCRPESMVRENGPCGSVLLVRQSDELSFDVAAEARFPAGPTHTDHAGLRSA